MEEVQVVRIKRMGIFSLGNTLGIAYGLIGFILGIIIVLLTFTSAEEFEEFLMIVRITAIIVIPILMYILGFISGIIIALLYNVSAKISKGIELHA